MTDPSFYTIVPKSATDQMAESGEAADYGASTHKTARLVYGAMLASAPTDHGLVLVDAGELERLKLQRDALSELIEVADLRGDSDLPHPCDDPKLWTARMQEAWDEARAAMQELKR